jgi:ethanolamine ammonia-lyase small subunit
MTTPTGPDRWAALAAMTPARIALGRAGASLPTREVLAFALDHARARDAVHIPFDAGFVAAQVEALGFETLEVASAAPDRASYLRRPDLGRRLAPESQALLSGQPRTYPDVLVVVADGLSSPAVHAHAALLLTALQPHIAAQGWRVGPVVLAHQGRVALGDEIGELTGARSVVLLLGERPGLSAADSLGAYLTHAPRLGRTDAERNCISNIRPAGLGYRDAALRIAWHIRESLQRGYSGVALKDESASGAITGPPGARGLSAPRDPLSD